MKKIWLFILVAIMVLPLSKVTAEAQSPETAKDFRAVWVSSVLNLDYPSAKGLTVEEIKSEAVRILDRAVEIGLNAVILQVRPTADALYPSVIFPWSVWLSGTQGVGLTDGTDVSGVFDPLAYWIDQAHQRGLELHAWINPYRISHSSQNITQVSQLSAEHPARLNSSWAILYQGALYFDPGLPACQQLIVDGVAEIVRNYAVDGIHLDDYFYPGTDFPDTTSYNRYGGGLSKDDWRRENVNTVIKAIQSTVKSINPNVRFGVSPAGIWQNSNSTPLGSDTRGNETYKSAFADTRRWVKEGWLDYICPQLYWHIGYAIADYGKLLNWWRDVCQGTGVDLYIGHAVYREAANENNWKNEIAKQLTLNAVTDGVGGSVFFRAEYLFEPVGEAIKKFYQSWPQATPTLIVHPTPPPYTIPIPLPDAAPPPTPSPTTFIMPPPLTTTPSTTPTPLISPTPAISSAPTETPADSINATPTPTLFITLPPYSTLIPLPEEEPPISLSVVMPAVTITKLSVAQPAKDISVTGASGYNILGTCVPGVPLYVNDTLVTNCTPEGFFSIYVPLRTGENIFTFKQAGQTTITRKITCKAAVAATPALLKTPAITNAYPAADAYVSAGDTLNFSCTAPAGAKVSVRFNGQTYNLTTSQSASGNATIYAATYQYTYKTAAPANDTAIVALGKPVYTMQYQGKSYTATAGGTIRLLGKDAPFYATITADAVWSYPQNTTTGGSSWLLLKGQKDRITTIKGDWVRLSTGLWVARSDVSYHTENQTTDNVLSGGVYRQGAEEDVIAWKSTSFAVLNVAYEAGKLTVRFAMQQQIPTLSLYLGQTVFSDVNSGVDNGIPYHRFTLRTEAKIEGYYVDYTDGELRLHIKKRKALSEGAKPLQGFSFVVDAGHGGSDTGAIGPMGTALAEKHINLYNAMKLSERLTRLGASVVMVRTADTAYSLNERTEISRKANPDMFISMHANSMAETTDASNIRGFSVWYRNETSLPLAEILIKELFTINPGTTRRALVNQSNFYVCRPAWAPSVIIETSFMCNVQDFAWLINDQKQNEMADAMVNAILTYYH